MYNANFELNLILYRELRKKYLSVILHTRIVFWQGLSESKKRRIDILSQCDYRILYPSISLKNLYKKKEKEIFLWLEYVEHTKLKKIVSGYEEEIQAILEDLTIKTLGTALNTIRELPFDFSDSLQRIIK